MPDSDSERSGDGAARQGCESPGAGAPAGVWWQRWPRRHRRKLLAILFVAAFFSVLGYFAKPVAVSGMCLVYP